MPFDRTAGQQRGNTRRPVKSRRLSAPFGGIVQNDNLAEPKKGGAEVLENCFPTPGGAHVRKGSGLHATIDNDLTDDVTHLAAYEFGATQKLFAMTAASVFDITSPASPTAEETPKVINLTSGYFSSAQFSTTGTHVLTVVNGADLMLQFDGTYWASVSTAAVFILPYDAETQTFIEGRTLTGGTSGATATIQRVIDNGTTGTLQITGITGTFVDNETVTGSGGGGSATSNIPSGVTQIKAALTGVTTSTLSHMWIHKGRMWFVKKETLSAYYLASGAVTGAATEFPLDGVFRKGGSLLFGASWSLDSGDGLDDVALFVTTEGEVAVYQGTNPASATTWELVGVYKIGRPLGKNCWFKAGGDLAIITDDGIVPVSQAVKQDRAALQSMAITAPIEDLWRYSVNIYDETPRAFEAVLWPTKSALFVSAPLVESGTQYCLVANSRTGAWTKYTNWDARCFTLLGDRMFFGTTSGTVMEAEIGGTDNGASYVVRGVLKFDSFGSDGMKAALQARIIARANRAFTPQLFCLGDFSTNYPTPLSADANEAANVWGSAIWGTAVWDVASEERLVTSQWQSVPATGYALGLGFHITIGSVTAPEIEIVSFTLRYEEGTGL